MLHSGMSSVSSMTRPAVVEGVLLRSVSPSCIATNPPKTLKHFLSNAQKAPGSLGYIGDDKLPSYVGIIMKPLLGGGFKDFYFHPYLGK